MTTPKKRGTRFEYRTAYLFESLGFNWDRSGSSLGIDLKISKRGRLCYLVNCKKTSTLKPIYMPKSEVKRLRVSAKETGAQGLVCFGFRRTPILTVTLEEIGELSKTRLHFKLTPENGRPLKDMLLRGKRFLSAASRGVRKHE
jgi:Holliday junction resolvase